MRRATGCSLSLLLALSCGLHAGEGAATDSGSLSTEHVLAIRGAPEVRFDVVGQLNELIRGFSLAMGHDTTRLALLRIETGPLFAAAELVTQVTTNEENDRGPPHGEIFVILDFQLPLDVEPVDLTEPEVLCTFVYSVQADAPEGPTPLKLRNREYGFKDREVSAIFVDARNQEVYPELSDGEALIVSTPVISKATPHRGSLEGNTTVTITGVGLAGPPEGKIYFAGKEATVLGAVADHEVKVLSPAAVTPGTVTVSFEGPLGTAQLADAFEYRSLTFLRGDCDGDSSVNITDAIFGLDYLFLGGAAPTCPDSCDVDDDGRLGVTDAIASLTFLFRGGPAPPSPFPGPGVDPTLDSLPCDS